MARRPTRSSSPNRKGESDKPTARSNRRTGAAKPRKDRGADSLSASPTLPGLNSRQIAAIASVREIFWHDVLREMLTSLAMRCAQEDPHRKSLLLKGAALDTGLTQTENMFDGRIAIITSQGQRIPIASVVPVFSMGVGKTPAERALSMAVECTVFQIRTPSGEVFTIPLHEIRAFHSMSEELIRSLENAARNAASEPDDSRDEAGGPFGFAAFTSLSRRAADVPLFAPPGSQPPDTGYLPA